jgi:hypothetical protein
MKLIVEGLIFLALGTLLASIATGALGDDLPSYDCGMFTLTYSAEDTILACSKGNPECVPYFEVAGAQEGADVYCEKPDPINQGLWRCLATNGTAWQGGLFEGTLDAPVPLGYTTLGCTKEGS